jgi:hypothetical protein
VAFLDLATDPAVQRVVLIDAPAVVVLAAVNEAALYIAGAADPIVARTEMGAVVDGMLARL